jgi:protein ImuB
LAVPERIAVVAEIPDGPPARFTWRRIAHRVVRAEGPERIAPEWWRPFILCGGDETPAAERVRDYYRIEDQDGGRFWVFREGLFDGEAEGETGGDRPPVWYLQGMFA